MSLRRFGVVLLYSSNNFSKTVISFIFRVEDGYSASDVMNNKNALLGRYNMKVNARSNYFVEMINVHTYNDLDK